MDPSQINLTQEENSQFIPFEMMQKYDGIDLSEMAIKKLLDTLAELYENNLTLEEYYKEI